MILNIVDSDMRLLISDLMNLFKYLLALLFVLLILPPEKSSPLPTSCGNVIEELSTMSQFSSSGSSAANVLQSTPFSENESRMPEFAVSDIDSEPINPMENKKLKTKYSKSEALNLLKDVGGALAAIKVIYENLADTEISALNDDELNELQLSYDKHAALLKRLNADFKSRKFRKNPKTLNTTFIKISDIPEFLKCGDNNEDGAISDENIGDLDFSDLEGDDIPLKEFPRRSYYKPLTQLKSSKIRNKRTKEDFDYFVECADFQKVEFCELLGHFLHRFYYNGNKQLAKFGQDLFAGKKDPSAVAEVGTEMGLHIFERYKFGKSSWISFRFLMKNICKLPTYQNISLLRASISPIFSLYFDESQTTQIGVVASVHDCLVKHLLRLIQSGNAGWLKTPGNFCAKLVFGMDSRGEEKEHQQRTQVNVNTSHAQSVYYVMPAIYRLPGLTDSDDSLNIPAVDITSGIVDSPDMFDHSSDDEPAILEPDRLNIQVDKIGRPLDFQQMAEKVWSDPTPASHRAVRNIGLIMEKENRENVLRLWKFWLEKEILELKNFQLSNSAAGSKQNRSAKDLRKPILIVMIPPEDPAEPISNCTFKSISVDAQVKGCDMKMTAILTGKNYLF